MPSFPVKFFHSGMENAPQLTNNFGVLTTLLDQCLINGFNTKSVTSITRTGTTATLTISGGHGFIQHQIIKIIGADQVDYNGEQRVTSVTATTLTFEVANSPITPATGTISVQTAPIAGWEIAYTGTNKRAYRSTNSNSNKPFLRIDDGQDAAYNSAYAKKGKVFLCEDMFNIDTPKGAYAPYDYTFPTKGWTTTGSGTSVIDGWYKWYYAKRVTNASDSDSTAPATYNRKWFLIGDDRTFYLLTEWGNEIDHGRAVYAFGDFYSYKTNDKYNSFLWAADNYVAASTAINAASQSGAADNCSYGVYFGDTSRIGGKLILKDHYQFGYPINFSIHSLWTNSSNTTTISGNNGGVPFPNAVDFGITVHPTYMINSTSVRGKVPGYYCVLNTITTGTTGPNLDLVVWPNVNSNGRSFITVNAAYNSLTQGNGVSRLAFDITGPWW